MRKAHDEKPWVQERMRQENRSSPQCQAFVSNSLLCCSTKSENTNIWNREPLATKIRKNEKSNAEKYKGNNFFRYFLCLSKLHFWRPSEHFWANLLRGHPILIWCPNFGSRVFDQLSNEVNGLQIRGRTRKLCLIQVDLNFYIVFTNFGCEIIGKAS